MVGRLLRAFGHFWWDFLIGDTPELFVATVVIVGAAFWLEHAAVVVLPLLAVVALVGSARRGASRGGGPT